MEKEEKISKIIIYQAKNGAIELKGDLKKETVWANQSQIAKVFQVDRTVITRHINNIFKDQELDKKVVCANFAHTTQHGAIKGKTQNRKIKYYNLDIILAVGYRTNSKIAINFRKWATKTLNQHITQGFTINPNRIQENYKKFLEAVEDIKKLSKNKISSDDILELIKVFSHTWFSLDAFDKDLKSENQNSETIKINSQSLYQDILILKKELISKNEATEIFAKEIKKDSLEGIIGNVFQKGFNKDFYPNIESKASNLLYFIIKDHPFLDGNKRSGAFSFIWILNKSGFKFRDKITPEALTAITLLIAISNPIDKDKIINLVNLLLKN